MLKPFFKVVSKTGPRMAFFEVKGDLEFKFWFCDPKKAHLCAEMHLLPYFRPNPCGRLGCR